MSAPRRYLAARFALLFLATLSFVDLLVMVVVVGLHAYLPSVPTRLLAPMTVVLAGASGSALVMGLLYSLLAYPAQRRGVLALTLIVLGLLAAHLYAINDPYLSATGSLTGSVGSTLHDNQVSFTSSISGNVLDATVKDSGGDALGSLSVSVGGVALPDSGFATHVTPTAALQPGDSVKGTWDLQAAPTGPITLNYTHLTCYALDKRVDGCVMDEVYYVPAAQTLLSGEKCAPYADNCNLEHPYLSKAFVAAGIAIFGNTAYGWRIFEVVLGTFSVPVLFALCWTITRNMRLSLFASFLLAFETLFFAHSSIAVIDVGAIFFGLVGFLLYFAKTRWWRLDNVSLAGVAFGLAALCKETAIFLFLVMFLYHLFFAEGSMKRVALSTVRLAAATFLVFAMGLEMYDGAFGAGTSTNFIGQIDFILKYGASLTMTPSSMGWIDPYLHSPITPLNWVTYYSPVGYLVTSVTVYNSAGQAAYNYISAGYYGITNQFEVWLVYLWLAFTLYLWRKTRGRFESESEGREFALARLAAIWFLVVFVGYFALFFYGRITYPYYFVSSVPSLALGGAYLLSRNWFPRPVAYIFLAGVFLWFFLYYPDKAFLPTQLRVWIGH